MRRSNQVARPRMWHPDNRHDVHIYCSREQYDKLKRIALKAKLPPGAVVRAWIDTYEEEK